MKKWTVLGLMLVGCAAQVGEGVGDEAGHEIAGAQASLTQVGILRGEASQPLVTDGIPLMQSFRFEFTSGDHHVKEIQLMPHRNGDDRMTVTYRDRNGDDQFQYWARYVDHLGPGYEAIASGRCRGTCSSRIARPSYATGWKFVVVGFRFEYVNSDHHIDELTLLEHDAHLTVGLSDRNDDDYFDWQVRYAYIPATEFSVPEASGYDFAFFGSGYDDIAAGSKPVIEGFDFELWGSPGPADMHLRALGLDLPGNGTADLWFGDRNPENDDGWLVEQNDFVQARFKYGIVQPPASAWLPWSPVQVYRSY